MELFVSPVPLESCSRACPPIARGWLNRGRLGDLLSRNPYGITLFTANYRSAWIGADRVEIGRRLQKIIMGQNQSTASPEFAKGDAYAKVEAFAKDRT